MSFPKKSVVCDSTNSVNVTFTTAGSKVRNSFLPSYCLTIEVAIPVAIAMPIPNNANKMKLFRQDDDTDQIPYQWQNFLIADEKGVKTEPQPSSDQKSVSDIDIDQK